MNKLILKILWPDKVFGEISKLMIMLALVVVWFSFIYWKIETVGYVTLKHFVSLYCMLIIFCFLFNKTLPIGVATHDYDTDSQGSQFIRFLICVSSLAVYYYCTIL
ncbi:hypothetical protein A1QK_13145 [Vibrio genomosp. F10 str. 9ZD137]|nr:hypothetical protein A1QK_13145 [Vibrio genomosp. F10 str. 9ZD137]